MFSQINESRDLGKIPVVVVGNKTDKVNDNIFKSRLKGRRDSDERRDFWEKDSEHGHHGGKQTLGVLLVFEFLVPGSRFVLDLHDFHMT